MLIEGDFEEILEDDENIFAWYRKKDGQKALVLVNFRDHEVSFDPSYEENMHVKLCSEEEHEPGSLKPLEAVLLTD